MLLEHVQHGLVAGRDEGTLGKFPPPPVGAALQHDTRRLPGRVRLGQGRRQELAARS